MAKMNSLREAEKMEFDLEEEEEDGNQEEWEVNYL